MRRNLAKLVLFLALLHLLPSAARADGCYIPKPPQEGGVADFKDMDSPRQQAILVDRVTHQEMYVRVVVRGAPEDFAWVLPLPADPVDAHLESDGESLFSDAYDWSAPEWLEAHDMRSDCGSESGSGKLAAGVGPPAGVVVLDEKELGGGLEMQVLEATGGNALEEWLQQNGYPVPDGLGALAQDYVDREWVFLAMKVTGAAAVEDEVAALHVMHLLWEGTETVFPMNLTRLNAPSGGLDLTLFALSEKCLRADGMSVYYSDERPGSSTYWTPAQSMGPNHTKLESTAGGMWLVRLTGTFTKSEMEDIYLYSVEEKIVHPETQYWAGYGGRRHAILLALAVLAVLALGGLAAVRWRTSGER